MRLTECVFCICWTLGFMRLGPVKHGLVELYAKMHFVVLLKEAAEMVLCNFL